MAAPEVARSAFVASCLETLAWLAATEALWLQAAPTTEVRRQLRAPQMEALYEAAFLRVFTAWEVFLEELAVGMMAGLGTSGYRPSAASGKSLHRSQIAARAALYGSQSYVLWHNAQRSADRIDKHLVGSPVSALLRANAGELENMAAVRHRIAHASRDSRDGFALAARSLCGSAHRDRPGHFLRAHDIRDPLNSRRWILVLVDELLDYASQAVA